ncbi:hypothetical protein IQ279_25030 [Streptomyces verrucosisporus]|uniref:hypothetical protein n=1 Tax=Streptomyces verrucosisporus TaxID=1695161 RepID=UPI0019D24ECD|nr:hypothetical protein [Streptomyces verrucosisporus]MBN3932836.1 hypothetical protein [Streptomyces verrucosisporus]
MAVTAFVIPPLLLCVMLALGRYEERMLGEAGPEPAKAPRERHLRAVPDLPAGGPSRSAAPREDERAA